DGAGRNSPFAGALVKHISTSNDDLSALLIDVRNDVRKETQNAQVPWEHSSLTGRFYFNLAARPAPPAAGTTSPPKDDENDHQMRERYAALVSQGNTSAGNHDYDRAIADYSEAIRLNPQYALAFDNRGNAYWNKADYDRALSDYNEAIRLDPKYASAYYNRGN